MSRRKRNNNVPSLLILKLVALCGALVAFNSSYRQFIFKYGALLIGAVLLIGVLVTVALVVRRLIRDTEQPDVAEVTVSSENAASIAPANLADSLRKIDWFQFEKVVAIVYSKLGYAVTRRGGANPDGGIDLIIEKDGQRTAVQCKQWKTWNVGVKAIREFLGALTDAGVQRGIFITLQGYTTDAKQLADKRGIEILDETRLTELLNQTDARFDPQLIAALNDPRKFCPKCEAQMVLRTAKKGPTIGQKFWGCSTYPKCTFKLQC